MRTRILEPDEWPRLAGTEAQELWRHLDPENARIIVVENTDGTIIATHTLMRVWHAECLWIHPAWKQRSNVLRKLWRFVQDTAISLGARTVVTTACDDRVRRLLTYLGAIQLDGTHHVIRLKGANECLRP